ncbi:hypothetical protein EJ02DRAFT_460695 [Clathrospora elynae]|uniref:F-box domain-containing protein n=1 Tax=Clathrospora elynae TaxID=706981 RepID=A0A6A5S9J3_9PLEO|nr:hypothetical protein EJ02DRAFT_460695 [Clathrospora elynae]
MTTFMATFGGLPEELIQETLLHLSSIRSSEPQSTAFRDKKKEKARQCENRLRQRTLHTLCLTSHHLRRIATPILYASFTGSATWQGIEPMKLFHRTILSPDYAVGLKIKLAEYVLYVENRLSDYLGNSLHDGTELSGASHMVARYFYLLADVVRHVPNLQHLSVVSLETNDVSFWTYVLPADAGTEAPAACRIFAGHGCRKLQTLCAQIHTEGYGVGADAASFRRICSAMTTVPLLSDFRASGVMTSGLSVPFYESFKNLQRLEITECVLDLDLVVDIWSACDGLRHITCAWAFLDCWDESPSDLYPGLLRHAETLESLHLDLGEVRFDYASSETLKVLGTLRPFRRLEYVGISETGFRSYVSPFLDTTHLTPPPRIAELLPEALKSFTLLLTSGSSPTYGGHMDHSSDMWDLVEDCQSSLPSLRNISIMSGEPLRRSPLITEAFSKIGVCLDLDIKDSVATPAFSL